MSASEEGSKPLTAVQVLYLQTPISAAVLFVPSVAFGLRSFRGSRFLTDVDYMLKTCVLILAGALLAFLLDIFNLLMVRYTSALSSVVAGCIKTVIVILFSWLVFRNDITALNAFGYVICLLGVVWYNAMKYQKLKDTLRTQKDSPSEVEVEYGRMEVRDPLLDDDQGQR
mmetsp:Transcript_9462/g.19386  ORF Transcript_9462/g.19386 Transcript_9462/m.19386 type:complete len:170 (+) Transcript_9462:906-1415(+)